MTRVLVLGGTAWLGSRVAAALLARGAQVTCLARGASTPPRVRRAANPADHSKDVQRCPMSFTSGKYTEAKLATLPPANSAETFLAQENDWAEATFEAVSEGQRVPDGLPMSEYLYHYSNIEGVKGILSSKTVWATDARYLNDSKELEIARQKVSEALARTAIDVGSSDELASRIIQEALEVPRGRCYVACFCKASDLLSQWRSYGSGELSYSLGFSKTEIRKMRPSSSADLAFAGAGVLYHPGEQQSVAQDVCAALMSQLSGLATRDPAGVASRRQEIIQMVNAVLTVLDVFFKDRSFSEEKEWRIALLEGADLSVSATTNYRVTNYGLAGYLTLSVAGSLLPVEEVVQGPTPSPEIASEGMRRYLDEMGYAVASGNVKTTGCTIR